MSRPLKRVPWSSDRPVKPDVDPLLAQIVPKLMADKRSNFAKANVSGLAQSTLKNWQNGSVRRPQCVSVQMAARMLGYELTLKKVR